MRNLLKPIDRQILKSPDQFTLRLNQAMSAINKLNNQKTDLNGWSIYDYGDWQEYEYVVPYTTTVPSGQRVQAAQVPLPAGKNFNDFSYAVSGFGGLSGHIVYGIENDSDGKHIDLILGNEYSGGTLTFVGTAYIRLRTL